MAPQKQTNYKRSFNAENYERLYPWVPKGSKAIIIEHVQARGESINEYVYGAISQRMAREGVELPPWRK